MVDTMTVKDTASPQLLGALPAVPHAQEVEPPTIPPMENVDVLIREEQDPLEMKTIPESMVFDEEKINKVKLDLSASEHKAVRELKVLVEEALINHQFTSLVATKSHQFNRTPDLTKEVSIWGVPLLKDNRSDVILLKFLRARDFDVERAFAMLKNTIIWRKDYDIDELIEEEFKADLKKVMFIHGHDKEGHPVCYNVYGEFQNKELYDNTFPDEKKRKIFLRWRIQFLERSIRELDFRPGGVCSFLQVIDLKNAPGPGKRELRTATEQSLQMLQDNYPEFVSKQVFINVPGWYLVFYKLISPFLTKRTKSKYDFASPSKTAETLLKYMSPEQVPIRYGGLSGDFSDHNQEFSVNDPAAEITMKPKTRQAMEIIVNDNCLAIWELRVLEWEVKYAAEFIPYCDCGYIIILTRTKKITPADEPVLSGSCKIHEPGKILLIIDNFSDKKKTLLFRSKIKPCRN